MFVSSTSDLKEEREAVNEEVTDRWLEAFLYEHVGANSASPEPYVLEKIRNSEGFIGILGGKYGSLYPPENVKSICEFEFDEASLKPGRRLMIFPKMLSDVEIEAAQKVFRNRIDRFPDGVWRTPFDSIEALRRAVRNAVREWLGEDFIRKSEATEPNVERYHRAVRINLLVCMLVCVVLGVAAIFLPISGLTVAKAIAFFLVVPIIGLIATRI